MKTGELSYVRLACYSSNPIKPTVPNSHNLDISFKMAKWICNLRNHGDKCFLCFGRFSNQEHVAFMPLHPKEYAHMHCFNEWFKSLNSKPKDQIARCPLCNCKAFMTCVECSKLMVATETIFNFHDHPGYHICIRCVAFNTNVTYDPETQDATGFYHGTTACLWCTKNKYDGVHTTVSLADVVPKETWSIIKCFKQMQVSMLSFMHHLNNINAPTSSIRLRDAYNDFFN